MQCSRVESGTVTTHQGRTSTSPRTPRSSAKGSPGSRLVHLLGFKGSRSVHLLGFKGSRSVHLLGFKGSRLCFSGGSVKESLRCSTSQRWGLGLIFPLCPHAHFWSSISLQLYKRLLNIVPGNSPSVEGMRGDAECTESGSRRTLVSRHPARLLIFSKHTRLFPCFTCVEGWEKMTRTAK